MLCGTEGVEAEKVGVDAANELIRNVDCGGCVDEFLQDQVNSVHLRFSYPRWGEQRSIV